jgi:hypothetical protein
VETGLALLPLLLHPETLSALLDRLMGRMVAESRPRGGVSS